MKPNLDKKNIILIILSLIIIILISLIFYLIYAKYNDSDSDDIILKTVVASVDNETTSSIYKVDIKGAVVNPGVYEVKDGSIVNDVIELAGGLKSNATTLNINLSQKVTDAMVIYVFTKSELTTTTSKVKTDVTCSTQVIEVNNCENFTTNSSSGQTANDNKLININTASKDELMTLSGIGESKADAIIEYRNNNKFTKIEDIMNVSGIGESAFEKIKDYITV